MNAPVPALSAGLAARVRRGLAAIWSTRLRRNCVRSGGAALLLLLALVLVIKLVLPDVVRTQAQDAVAQKLHRRLAIDALELHPFALQVVLVGVRLYEPDGTTVFASLDRLELAMSASSLWHLAPVVRELRLDGPYLHWARTAPGHFSTDDIVAALAQSSPAAPPAPGPLPRFAVNNIRISGGRFDFDDLPRGAHDTVSEFTLALPFVSSFAAQVEVFVEPALSARINGAPLRLRGDLKPFAPDREARLQLDLDDLDLTHYAAYLPAGLALNSGHLDLHLNLASHLPVDAAPRVALSGTTTLRQLELKPGPRQPALKFASLALALRNADFPTGHLDATLTVNGAGRISAQGETALAPLHADLALNVQSLDLLPLQALFQEKLNLRLTRARLQGEGRLQMEQASGAALQANFQGGVALENLAAVDALSADDFVSWDALALRGIQVQLAPLTVHLDEIALKNFFARVIVRPDGRINLQDILRTGVQSRRSLTDASTGAGATDAAPAPASPAAPAPARTSAPVPVSESATREHAAPVVPVSIGRFVLSGGHVRYTDNFIKPRYTAELMDLNGSVAGLSSDAGSTALVDVHGQVNDAPLLIAGRVNPLARDLRLDIQASVHDMELAPLSPYSHKYVGYRIARGKMSFEVAYQLQDRQLHAQNHLILNQLTFGEKLDSPSATGLPVQLAIALLKDRHGVIDVELPIEGSLDDPQFSIGGILLRVVVNLVTKAVTAPFALLGSLFGGGGEELSWLEFRPGESVLTPGAQGRLQALATALTERPGLSLDITGGSDPAVDRGALQRQRVEAEVLALRRQDMAASGTLAGSAGSAMTAQEHEALLARLYRQRMGTPAPAASAGAVTPGPAAAPLPSADEQQTRLAAQQTVGDDDLRELGDRRAQAVKAWLRTSGAVPEERLALVGAHLSASGPRVDFSLH